MFIVLGTFISLIFTYQKKKKKFWPPFYLLFGLDNLVDDKIYSTRRKIPKLDTATKSRHVSW